MNLIDPPFAPFYTYNAPWLPGKPIVTSHFSLSLKDASIERFASQTPLFCDHSRLEYEGFIYEFN